MKLSKINKKKSTFIIIALFFLNISVFSKGTAGTSAAMETRYIVDMPTAGVLSKGRFNVRSVFFTDGGVALYSLFAPFTNFNVGLSYSGTNIIGSHDMTFQKLPGFEIAYRIVDEKLNFPALTLGFNSQGTGQYFSSDKRFATLSPGFYLASSKTFTWLPGWIALHGGICYTFEQKKDMRLPNLWLGLEQSLGPWASANLEYNTNIDEGNHKYMTHKGLLNAALRVALTQTATVELQVRDLLGNSAIDKPYQRYFSIDYIGSF